MWKDVEVKTGDLILVSGVFSYSSKFYMHKMFAVFLRKAELN